MKEKWIYEAKMNDINNKVVIVGLSGNEDILERLVSFEEASSFAKSVNGK